MNNSTLQIKFKQRLNKLDSMDYDNIECWQIAEAFNKAQLEWARRQLHGHNGMKELPEQSITAIDDLQVLLVQRDLKLKNLDLFFESLFSSIPKNTNNVALIENSSLEALDILSAAISRERIACCFKANSRSFSRIC